MTMKSQLEATLRFWGATPDERVENVWWLNGHCIILVCDGPDDWRVEEL